MPEIKTQPNDASVEAFLDTIADAQKRQDSFALVDLMRDITRAEPKMWGSAIIGFGNQHYAYESGREGDWFLVGFSPRKQNLTLYLTTGFERHEDLLKQLGKHSTGKACLYIKKLADVDLATLRALVQRSVNQAQKA
jgi:hypothetical protein